MTAVEGNIEENRHALEEDSTGCRYPLELNRENVELCCSLQETSPNANQRSRPLAFEMPAYEGSVAHGGRIGSYIGGKASAQFVFYTY